MTDCKPIVNPYAGNITASHHMPANPFGFTNPTTSPRWQPRSPVYVAPSPRWEPSSPNYVAPSPKYEPQSPEYPPPAINHHLYGHNHRYNPYHRPRSSASRADGPSLSSLSGRLLAVHAAGNGKKPTISLLCAPVRPQSVALYNRNEIISIRTPINDNNHMVSDDLRNQNYTNSIVGVNEQLRRELKKAQDQNKYLIYQVQKLRKEVKADDRLIAGVMRRKDSLLRMAQIEKRNREYVLQGIRGLAERVSVLNEMLLRRNESERVE